MITKEIIKEELKRVIDPYSKQNIIDAGFLSGDVFIDGNTVSFALSFKNPEYTHKEQLRDACTKVINEVAGDEKVDIKISLISMPAKLKTEDSMSDVRNIIAIASGKGGVGKSTITSNLAVALAKTGAKVGILDADIFGPSMPKMFGVEDIKPKITEVNGKDRMMPLEKYGVKVISLGFFVDKDDAMVWRGSMATSALKQLINDTHWGDLDFLLLDLPPGTSDIHLTMVQNISVTAAVIVSTPQDVALADARRGLKMFTMDPINIPVLGFIENMAWFTPDELPDNKYYIFGKDGMKKLSEEKGIELLGQIPIVQAIREGGDNGTPKANDENSIIGEAFKDLAKQLIIKVEERNVQLPPTEIVEITIK